MQSYSWLWTACGGSVDFSMFPDVEMPLNKGWAHRDDSHVFGSGSEPRLLCRPDKPPKAEAYPFPLSTSACPALVLITYFLQVHRPLRNQKVEGLLIEHTRFVTIRLPGPIAPGDMLYQERESQCDEPLTDLTLFRTDRASIKSPTHSTSCTSAPLSDPV